jgi:hypothetical protein
VTVEAAHYCPSDEERKLHEQFTAEVNRRELASADNFDKSILTLSSAGLGLSLSFLKDIGGVAVVLPWALYLSWVMFVLATVSTMSSFLVSARAMEHHKGLARRAYLEGDHGAFGEENKWDRWTRRLNQCSAAFFFLALALTITFVITNVEGRRMATNSKQSPPAQGMEHKGITVPTMQRPAPSSPASGGSQPSGQPPTPGKNG